MRDWIVGYEKGAAQKRPGVTGHEWADAEGTLGSAPEELRDLYRAFNGATFTSGVHLFPLHAEGPHRGLLEESRISVVGLPEQGVWRFGEKGSKHLFAISKSDVSTLENAPRPEWLESADDAEWVYGVKDELTQVVKLYRNLETLLSTLIPPAESEEFGERTYARAMTLVQSALDGLEDTDELIETGGERTPAAARPAMRAKSQAKKAKPARKAAKKVAPKKAAKVKAKPARKAAKKVAPKKAAKAKAKPVRKAAKNAAPKREAKKAPKKAGKRGGRR